MFNQYTDWKDRNEKHPEHCVQVNRAEVWPTETFKGKKAKSQKVSRKYDQYDQKARMRTGRNVPVKPGKGVSRESSSQCPMSHGGQSLKHSIRLPIIRVYYTKLKEGSDTVAVSVKAGHRVCARRSLNCSLYSALSSSIFTPLNHVLRMDNFK